MKTAEAERATATRPMAERGMREAMEYALNTDGIDGVVIDPWTNSATLDGSILNGEREGTPLRPPLGCTLRRAAKGFTLFPRPNRQ